MVKIKFKNVPVNIFFWRENRPNWWFKQAKDQVIQMGTSGALEVLPDPDEDIIVDPKICPNCWKDFPTFPPTFITCPFCGNIEPRRRTYDEIKQVIVEWTGNPDPNI